MRTTPQNPARVQKLLRQLLLAKSLNPVDARFFFEMLFAGQISFQQAKAFLLLLAAKGENADELLGCLQALREHEKPIGPKIPFLMDTCGTGGDGRQTLNISTLAALIIAGAGGKVAKHGNRAISSQSGSSDLMEAFGVNLSAPKLSMIRAVQKIGFGYFHAPFFHPVFAKMQPLRTALKQRTILNLLGPLVNPMRLDYQLVGVSNKCLVPLYAKVLSRFVRKSALVCHSTDGLDEISTAVPTVVAWVTPKKIRQSLLYPKTFGLQKASLKDIRVSSVAQSKRLAEKILTGKERGPARDIVILNAACGFMVCQKARTIQEGIQLARQSLDSGNAYQVLKRLIEISNQ